ncbi:dual specificity protein kinase [Pelomyxa schiedti]|nr:dual specificity protein kinase [Pelomyxa schiedti]
MSADTHLLCKSVDEIVAKKLDHNAGLYDLRSAMHVLCVNESELTAFIKAHETQKSKIKDAEKSLEKAVAEIARIVNIVTTFAEKRPDIVKNSASPGPIRGESGSATSTSSSTSTTSTSTPTTPATQVQDQDEIDPGMYGAGATTLAQQGATRLQNVGPPEIPPTEIHFDKDRDYLGGGAFGSVYRASCRGTTVAVKIPLKQHLTPPELQMFRHEVMIMRKIFHPNVVLCLGACTNPGNLIIVTELMQRDLDNLIHTPELYSRFSIYQKLIMARDAGYGMNWLHGICKIIHRDLKPANLLLDEHNHVKVTDFGFSETLKTNRNLRDMKGPKGTALYMAPEVMRLEEFNEKADVYSFGLILYELFTGEEPFATYNDIDSFFQAVCIEHERPIIAPEIERTLPPTLVALIKRCWDKLANNRPLFPEVLRDLNFSIIECQIEEPQARQFWRDHFYNRGQLQEVVPVEDFVPFVTAPFGTVSGEHISLFTQFIGTTSKEHVDKNLKVVTMERFNQLGNWFGLFFVPAGRPIFDEIVELKRQVWFAGDIERMQSEVKLVSRKEGTFLVRVSFNDSKNTPFTVSKVKGTAPVHKRVNRITYDPRATDRYSVPLTGSSNITAHTIPELVSKLQAVGNITEPCGDTERSDIDIYGSS